MLIENLLYICVEMKLDAAIFLLDFHAKERIRKKSPPENENL